MTVTLASLPSETTWAETSAPLMYGLPTLVSFPSSVRSTLSKVTEPSLLALGSFSTLSTLSFVTTYCFPPVSMIAIFAIGRVGAVYDISTVRATNPCLFLFPRQTRVGWACDPNGRCAYEQQGDRTSHAGNSPISATQ